MATTTPDHIAHPDSDNQYALVQALGALAASVQAALLVRANSYVGTIVERTAFTASAANGVLWQDTDGARSRYVFFGSSWVLIGDKFYSGTESQRVSFTGAPDGAHWQETGASSRLFRRSGGQWIEINKSTGWVNLTRYLDIGYAGTMEGIIVGRQAEIRYSVSGAIIPIGASIFGTLPPEWRPGGTINPRGAVYYSGDTVGSSYIQPADGKLGLVNGTGATRTYAATSISYMLP